CPITAYSSFTRTGLNAGRSSRRTGTSKPCKRQAGSWGTTTASLSYGRTTARLPSGARLRARCKDA
ncbi:MAG: hypothetical protein AVDCRST_MAG90-3012, partial [uncultured Microvirga sp.]